jgi:hypothetical protein
MENYLRVCAFVCEFCTQWFILALIAIKRENFQLASRTGWPRSSQRHCSDLVRN